MIHKCYFLVLTLTAANVSVITINTGELLEKAGFGVSMVKY